MPCRLPDLPRDQLGRLLGYFFLLTYGVVLFVSRGSVDFSGALTSGPLTLAFMLAAYLSYGVIYLMPAMLLVWATRRLVHLGAPRHAPAKTGLVYPVAVLATGLTTLICFANAQLYALYGMFINGFVINLIFTPGGIESLGGSSMSTLGFALVAIGFLALQALLLLATHLGYTARLERPVMPRHFFRGLVLLFLALSLGERFTYAASDAFARDSLISMAEEIPFYQPFTARNFFRLLGYDVKKVEKHNPTKGRLHYPLRPIAHTRPGQPYNIVWLVSESLRADMLDAEIMPQTWQFAGAAQRFTRHYSGGNGTRVGIFSQMTGLPGSYWFSFLQQHQPSALVDVLQAQDYQMSLYTSARFSYPEFDKTIFSKIPQEKLHWIEQEQPGWMKDRINVDHLLDFVDHRDPSRPFFVFMFFESPHARYYFPPESVIRTPYRDDINYATLSKEDLSRDIAHIRNRYINAVHHLDSQFGRVFEHLRRNNLLENTIVVATGDHGEEFMEHGYWGHNSTFVDPQVRTPLVVWMPGRAAAVHHHMTSHMDIVPTLMPRLGVTNPSGDYSTGYDLFSGQRKSTLLCDWGRVGYVDDEVKISLPTVIRGISGSRITNAQDEPLPAAQATQAFERKQKELVHMMQELGRFVEKGH